MAAGLYRAETLELEHAVSSLLAKPIARIAEDAEAALVEVVRQAYVHGLRDGYAQGASDTHRNQMEEER